MAAGMSAIIGPSSSVNVKASYPMTMGFHVPMISPGATDPMLESSTYRYTTGRIQIKGLTTLPFLFLKFLVLEDKSSIFAVIIQRGISCFH